MTYSIELSRSATKALTHLKKSDLRKIKLKLDALQTNPFPQGSEKMQGGEDFYRIRSGDYRIIYQVFNKKLVVFIIKIGHRRDVYRFFN